MKNIIYFIFLVFFTLRTFAQGEGMPDRNSDKNSIAFTNMTSELQKDADRASLTLEDQVIDLARKAVGNSMKLQAKARVELKGNQYIVTFGTKLPDGVRGADYEAQVHLSAKTGKVEKVLVGS